MSAGRPERREGAGRSPHGPGRAESPDGGHERDEEKRTGNAAVNEQGGKRTEQPEEGAGEEAREPGPSARSASEADGGGSGTDGPDDDGPVSDRSGDGRSGDGGADEAAVDRGTTAADVRPAEAVTRAKSGGAEAEAGTGAGTAGPRVADVPPAEAGAGRAEPTASFDEDDLRRLLSGGTPPLGAPAAGRPGALDPELDGPAPLEEDDLRRILHGAADGLGPADTDATLEHLRRAIPARRARKRQAVVGMAAAALFVGTAVPALVHVTSAPSSDARPSIAGHGEDVQGGTGGEGESGSEDSGAGPGKDGADAPGAAKEKERSEDGRTTEPGEDPGGSPAPDSARAAASPLCDATQLGSASTTTEGRGSDGSLYGTFRVTNVSDRNCTVAGSGSVSAVASGAADVTKVNVVPHTPGDPATGLPSPITLASQLVLAPGAAYEVKFAWIPSESCPNTGSGGGEGGNGGTTPTDPAPPAEGSSGGTDQGSTAPDVQPQLMRADGGKADGSVTVTHTADPGAPSTGATVPDACAGTVYHTGALPAGG
ncbi:hypothetical protein Srut_13900 [Streptomyces rutgersensis]|nr:hypothetical protein Srut_13900 [Streptomyces rutgersensis]